MIRRPRRSSTAVGLIASLVVAASLALAPSAHAQDDTGPAPSDDLAVAVVVDLRLPPAHSPDGGATFDQASLDRVLDIAQVLIDRPDVPLTVSLSPETLDALALIGDDESLSVLLAAVDGRQILVSSWTSIDVDGWIAAGRADVVTDGLDRGHDTLAWAGLEASTVMRSDSPPTAPAVTAIAGPATGVSAFVGEMLPWTSGPPILAVDAVSPVTLAVDSSMGTRPLVLVDSLLAVALKFLEAELGMRSVHAELLRMAAEDARKAVVVPVAAHVEPSLSWQAFSIMRTAPLDGDSGPVDTTEVVVTRRGSSWSSPAEGIEPTALARLLDLIVADNSLRPVTLDEVLAQVPPVGALRVTLADPPSDPGDFGMYLARRTQVEQRLQAYESFLGDDALTAEPLRTLLAISAGQHLTTGERAEFLDAVDQQVTQGVTGLDLLGRGPITVTERRADLPVTLVNDRPTPVTVALELTSDGLEVTPGARPVFTLAPGRNDLAVPVEADASGRASIQVTVTTPDPAGTITLAAGSLSVRFADAEGLGLLILVWAAAAVAAWWVHSLRKRSRVVADGGGTVAARGAIDGADNRGASDDAAATSTGDQTKEPT